MASIRWDQQRWNPGRFVSGGNALDHNAGGLEVGDAVIVAVAHVDGLGEQADERAGGLREPPVCCFVPIHDQIVSDAAAGAKNRRVELSLERVDRQLAERLGAGADGGDLQAGAQCELQVLSAELQRVSSEQSAQRGLRAMQTWRPWKMTRWL